MAGTVASLGPGVTGWAVDQRVLLQAGEERNGLVYTRGVDYDGGWAQYAVARADTLVAVPDDLPLEQACIIPDAVSTPWAAITATAGVRPAQPVGVWGIGGLGAHGVQLLRAGARLSDHRRRPGTRRPGTGAELGADVALDPAAGDLVEQVRAATGEAGLAFAFDFAGVAAVREQAVRCLAAGGGLAPVGLTKQPLTIPDGTAFSYFGQKVLGHYGSTPAHVAELVQLIRHHRVDFARSITATLPLSEAAEGVARLERKEGNPIRLVLQP